MKRRRPLHTTVPAAHPPKRRRIPALPKTKLPARPAHPRPTPKPPRPRAPKPLRHDVARIIDDSERSLVDVIDNLLNQGVMLHADVILALANVDLIYLRLSALLCAADRVLPGARR